MNEKNKFLIEILKGREERAFEIKKLNEKFHGTIICLTLNIPGPDKLDELYYYAFNEATKALEASLNINVLKERAPLSGYEAYFVSDKDIKEIKRIALTLEKEHPLGRLFDIDIFYKDLSKISRKDLGEPKRKCFLCGEDAVSCGRSRKHSVFELTSSIKEKILQYKNSKN
ncbi:citrate lyase holo-[acyl-carrier protein] synthase [Clostridium perfringens]|uniref:citrate lyase holo-[acyl-carrier protein] synthase n=1 Tax=Clostridium perfringens TaxID=1502 RepID=UPI001158EE1C|nr:citrate lyase holo-[acyl-carrier protein] synthase [Clostridium perfringens]EHK2362434.1 citrate lyase holo-[acyl-carrier protein] synthase [Clostridium perfringens]EHR1329483.1 citrate lyase holo-[acyl-carrier protein] synthase [Clostridium perfringens]EHR1332569.1 citrate lyase holo-[acyl-carrier protein] synthase [Clostridium perfringens]EHR1426149.1 citrate lyase holo-[acyl-carrier protein] synthase [Clostridium perfringens]EIF6164943.1 citrate lyase holo-[acyl-carrier protein] synthase